MFDLSIVVFILIVMCAASTGAIFSPGDWYERLDKPSWTPPNWVFPVVWTILYIMIAIAGWLVWKVDGPGLAIALWGIQILLNGAWSAVFFGLYRMDWAFVVVVLLAAAVLAFAVVSWPISAIASLLFVPYLTWVCIAAALNFTVWQMNSSGAAG